MTKVTLTEREYEVMQILWKNGKPMLASEVNRALNIASGNSTHHLLNRLMEKGVVKVAGNIKIVKAQSRLYAPTYSAAEYMALLSSELYKAIGGEIDVKTYLLFLAKKNKNKNTEILNAAKEFVEEIKKEANN